MHHTSALYICVVAYFFIKISISQTLILYQSFAFQIQDNRIINDNIKVHTKSINCVPLFTDMSFSNSYRRTLFIAIVIMLVILVASPQFGAAWRPLFEDGLVLQLLPRGPPNPSKGDPTHP